MPPVFEIEQMPKEIPFRKFISAFALEQPVGLGMKPEFEA